jgi:uncharacterized C2H2 Zn-finger protein
MIEQTVETVTFPCEDWVAMRSPQGELVSVNPIAGTWCLVGGEDRRRFADKGMDVKAFFACPKCTHVGFISESFAPVVKLGDAEPTPPMRCKRCNLVFRVILKDWDKRKLYCACYETATADSLATHKVYLHAEDELEAKKFFWAQHGSEVTNLVGIAPVIGFFTPNPKDERKLIV